MRQEDMDELDRAIMNRIQKDMPLTPRPFAVMAEELAISEEELIVRIKDLRERGLIRKLGAFFDSEKLGYAGTLVAVKVEPEFLAATAQAINLYAGVTHNYERENEYNLWCTLLTDNISEQQQFLQEVAAMPGVLHVMNLPASRKYKVNVRFAL